MMTSPGGDPRTLASRVYGEHGYAVRRYFHRLTRNPDVADDLAQEVFLKVVRAADAYRPQERERAWVFRIAQNVLLDHYRRVGRAREDQVDVEPVQAFRGAAPTSRMPASSTTSGS